MFKVIKNISDVAPFVADKPEIKFSRQSNGVVIGCYMYMDSKTFDAPEALECRGIAFDEHGDVVSRPLHKFFNVGEKTFTTLDAISNRAITGVFDKIDGSMIATSWSREHGLLRSKKSYTSSVVVLAQAMLDSGAFDNVRDFATEVAANGMTAVFELTHPQAQIVVSQKLPQLRLLHVRDNASGEYVLQSPTHNIHALVNKYHVPMVHRFGLSLDEVVHSLEGMKDQEGYVLQFDDGDMVKIKCPWYLRLHRSITFLRERDIARAALHEDLDDIKSAMREVHIDIDEVERVESRLKTILLDIENSIETAYQEHKDLGRKDFAITLKDHPYFGFVMNRYVGKESDIKEWYERTRLRDDFGLRVLVDDARAEELDMGGVPAGDKPRKMSP